MPSPFSLFVAAVLFFHVSEFTFAAIFNRARLEWASWLISGPYVAAMAFACLEYALELRWAPWMNVTWVTGMGLAMVVAGEALRKLGICTAQGHFTHRVQVQRRPEHRLVTWGVYSYMRHPGYAGWVLWAVGTQVLLCNPASVVLFTMASMRFMQRRVTTEDQLLHQFFGEEWLRWQSKVPSGLPLVP